MKEILLRLLPGLAVLTLGASPGCSATNDGGNPGAAGAGTGGSGNAAGTGGAMTGTGGSANGDPTQFPTDTTIETIQAFLDAEHHRAWNGDPAIRRSDNIVNPHGENIRVFVNDVGLASTETSAPPQTMAVKELYDAEGTLVGRAASMKAGEAERDWVYFCAESEGGQLCTGEVEEENPIRGEALSSCGICHSGGLYAPIP